MPTYRITTDQGEFDIELDREVPEDQLLPLAQEYLARGGEAGGGEQATEGPGLLRRTAAFGVRVGAPIVGGAGGFLAGGPLGAAAGAGIAGAAGEALAEAIEGEELDPLEIGLAGGLSALPAGPFARAAGKGAVSLGKQVALHAAEGATQGALAETARSIAKEGELPELGNVATSAAGGAVVGSAFGAVAGRQARRYDRATAAQARQAIFGGADEAAEAVKISRPVADFTPAPVEPEAPAGNMGGRPFTRIQGLAGEAIPDTQPMPPERVDELADEFVNRVFADMPDDARKELSDVYKAVPDLIEAQTRGRQTIERTKTLAREIALDPDDILPAGTAANAEQIAATTNLVSTLHARMRQLRAKLAQNPDDALAREELRQEHARFVNTSVTLAGLRSEAGRSLRIHQEVLGEVSPAARAARFSAQARKFGASVDDIIAALDRAGDDPVKQYRELLNIARSDWKTKAHSYYVMNLLTNPKTWERNLFGNFVRAIEDPLLRPVAGGIDAVTSAVTGRERRVFAGEGWQMILGAKKSLPDAWTAVLQVMKRGFTDRQAIEQITSGKFDVRPEPFAGGAANPYNLISRGLEATDQFFRILNMGMQRDALAFANATRLAQKELTDGTIQQGEFRERIATLAADLSREYADAPPKEIAEQAMRSVFREDNAFATWLAGADKLPLPARAAIKFMLPFVKTPANIIRQGFEHSPAGFAMKGARGGDRNARFRQAEAALGTVVLGSAAWMALNGYLAPSAPEDPKKREAFYAKFPLPNALFLPGHGWVPYSDLGPLGTGLGIVADFIQGWQDVDAEPDADDVQELLTRTTAALMSAGSGLFERSFLSGLADAMEAMRGQDPKAVQRFIQNRVVSLVPFQGLGRAVTQAEDATVRETKTLGEKVQSIVPPSVGDALGIPDAADLPARLDAFGQPIQRPQSGAESLILMSGAEPRQQDAVRVELERFGIQPQPTKPIKELKLGSNMVALTRPQEHALREAKGRLRHAFLSRAIASPTYQKANEEVQERILKRQMSRGQKELTERARFLLRRNREFTVEALLQGIAPEGD